MVVIMNLVKYLNNGTYDNVGSNNVVKQIVVFEKESEMPSILR